MDRSTDSSALSETFTQEDPAIEHLVKRQSGQGSSTTEYPLPEIDASPGKSPGSRAGSVISTVRWWLPEIPCSVVSILSFIATVIVAHVYNGKDSQNLGLPDGLSLNGVISILSTVNRAALMVPVGSVMSQELWLWFSSKRRREGHHAVLGDLEKSDAASRGAWGSLLFLLRPNGRWLASLGAVITILALGFSTFNQQLVAYGISPVADDALKPGIVPRIESYAAFEGDGSEGGYTAPLQMKAAMTNAILGGSAQQLPASCPTGNCSWPVTPSLAVCGACSQPPFKSSCDSHICNYTMPSGVMHTLWNGTGVEDDDTKPSPPGTLFASGSLFWVTQTNGWVYHRSNSTQTYLTNFDVFGAPFEVRRKDWLEKDMVAWECALWMCVQAFEVTTSSSSHTQIPIQNFSTIANMTHDIFTDASFDKINTFENLTFEPLPPSMNPAPQSQYQFSIQSALTMSSYLTSAIKGNAGADLWVVSFSSDTTKAIANATTGSLEVWIKSLATSMTNVLRSSTSQAGGFDVPIDVTPSTDAIYSGAGYQLAVQVRWPWIVLPALLVLLSLVVLVTTMIRTSWRSIGAWRGSPLVFLFLDIDAEIRRHAVGQMDVRGGLQDRVGKEDVVLEKERDGEQYLRSARDP